MMQNAIDLIPYGDVLYPTEEEFSNFRSYVSKLATCSKYADASLLKVL